MKVLITIWLTILSSAISTFLRDAPLLSSRTGSAATVSRLRCTVSRNCAAAHSDNRRARQSINCEGRTGFASDAAMISLCVLSSLSTPLIDDRMMTGIDEKRSSCFMRFASATPSSPGIW